MVFVILFDCTLHVPLYHNWGSDLFEACPSCVRAHELRTCDGETAVRFEICQKHEDAAKDPFFDDSMLNEIRTLTHPLHSPVQNFPVNAAGETATCVQELRKKVKETVNYMDHQRGPRKVIYSEFDLTPLPTFTYAHAKGCIHSDEPAVVLKSRADVRRMDEDAKETLARINALLGAGVDHDLSAYSDGESTASVSVAGGSTRSVDGEGAVAPDHPGSPPTMFVSAAASPESDEELSLEEAEEERRMAWARENKARSRLRGIKKRLEECLATSSLAKAVYFKRCNRQWVSALGGVLLDDGHRQEEIEAGPEAEANTKTDPPLRQCHDEDENENDNRDEKSVLSTFTALTLNTTINTYINNSDLTPSTTATSVSNSTTPNVVECNANSGGGGGDGFQVDIDTDTSLASSGYAVIDPADLLSLGDYASKLDSSSSSPSLSLTKQVSKGCLADLNRHNLVFSPRFEYRTCMLMAREELVRIGQVSETDLALTSWGYNRLVKKQAKAHEEEVKANRGVVSGDGARAA
ncbi:hypothetical protein G647_01992 [Cladophialophora carrionii CBS 160.54]|uniref:Uncharacterized protein n=1 Tax=Cladophialophora carrionii CBS 160.54 TaxID=1279043 RepID=V9DRL9_9EURO|nr:uncharacterized protein G647_01992 [Cladophialophora carrionii CBS 160.54]ETI29539.1 hypothetical protein G647_01992 [Cladophialophora carrionii CBS 160.54]